MEHQTTELSVVVYSVCAAVIGGFFFLIWHMYSRILKTQDAFIEDLRFIRDEQLKQTFEIKNNHEHIVRLERVQVNTTMEIAEQVVTKLRAAGGY